MTTQLGTDLPGHVLPDSEQTWREDRTPVPALPDELTAERPRGLRARGRALWQRHAIRRARAEEILARSLSPERGLPVARPRDV
ncbi:MAG: ABC transporter ATP-binding protein, partial [Actinomycetia bacterium]|nr:ABC transporter ATP-binding protein [Actinomycetes bacterium]